ncbi:unnamed protein product [Aureobasidium pullulans]|nr:unnamed protein product [Aureobasidium pullulans]CAD0057969.1 unnamed protein product [Aureobasidium pullulans]
MRKAGQEKETVVKSRRASP